MVLAFLKKTEQLDTGRVNGSQRMPNPPKIVQHTSPPNYMQEFAVNHGRI
jgi:hypothetical protein